MSTPPPNGFCYHAAFIGLNGGQPNLPATAIDVTSQINYFVNVTGKDLFLYNSQSNLWIGDYMWQVIPGNNWFWNQVLSSTPNLASLIQSGLLQAIMVDFSPISRTQGTIGDANWNDNWTVQQIVDGTWDTYFQALADQAKAFGYTIYLRIGLEMNINQRQGDFTGEALFAQNATTFVNAWRRIVDIFRSKSVTNVKFVWNPNCVDLGPNHWTDYYPGDSYVDWVGIDLYQYVTTSDPATLMSGIYNDYSAVKPIMICEWGVGAFADQTRADFVNKFFDAIEARPAIKLITYQYGGESPMWDMATYPLTTTAYRNRIANPRYLSTTAGTNTVLLEITNIGTGQLVSSSSLTICTPQTFELEVGNYHLTATYLQSGEVKQADVTIVEGINPPLDFLFAPSQWTLTVIGGTPASATGTPSQYVTVTATVPQGYHFVQWILDGTPTTDPNPLQITFNDTNAHTLEAVIALNPTTIDLTIVAGANGQVTPTGTYPLTIGSAYQFFATADTGYDFDHWDLAGENKGSSTSLLLQITADMDGKTLTALFTAEPPPKVTMALAIIGNGSTDLAPGTHQFNVGDTITITAITQSGETFLRWTVGATEYTMNPLKLPITQSMDGQTITAEFVTLTQAGFPLWALIPIGIGAVGTWYAVKGDKHKKKR